MDFQTSGDRGLGRMTDYIPRLGGYFRGQLSSLSSEEKSELCGLIQDIILRGYLVRALFVEAKLEQAKISSGSESYENWIPGIYSDDPSSMGENLRNLFGAITNTAFVAIRMFFKKQGMKGGGFLSKDKTDIILLYYPLAGFGLRLVEVRGH